MNRPPLLLAALALLLAGCGDDRSGTLGPAPTAASPTTAPPATSPRPATPPPQVSSPPPTAASWAPTSGTPTPRPTGTRTTTTVQLWFVRDGTLAPTRRTRAATVATSRLALAELAAGPTPAETGAGMATLVPGPVEVTRIAGGTATVVPPSAFAAGDERALRLRRAQVVWTLTQFPAVRRVAFAGGPAELVLTRADLDDLLAPIVVTEPVVGQRVTRPVTVAGTANVYEATVSIRVLDASGRVVGTGFTTASCGTGCRGDYRATVTYRLPAAGAGTVEVYEVSPQDGSRAHVVTIPVQLAATG
ncbi:Gmad2 immunoglobulin-like domain-containing protein [Micromonospora psammae]|uniref:Gmad2 immunoglobulin-like domain-containing protein n=1 Tax=Micromonospora sp. CPCC 205556 TaxID=3122398 RepID=UPI002FF27FE2